MREQFFEERGISYRINNHIVGRSTLVFIHGLSGSSSAWYPYEEPLGATYNLVTLDLRGHGKSRKPKGYAAYELKNSADDVYALLAHLHIERCILVSHSYGTLVALEFITAHPECVSAVVLLSPTSFLKETRWFSSIKILGSAIVKLFSLLPFHPNIRGRVDYSPYTYTTDWNLRRIAKDLRGTSLRVYMCCLMQAYAKDYDPVWKHIAVPALIMHGTEDTIIPLEHSVRLAKEIPGSELVVLDHTNHVIVLNNIAEVTAQIQDFAALNGN